MDVRAKHWANRHRWLRRAQAQCLALTGFLAVDNHTNDLVVIEPKGAQTGDAALGQVLRDMGWVRENLAGPGQGVQSITICRVLDDSLRYAVSQTTNVSVLTYRVDFLRRREFLATTVSGVCQRAT